MKLSPEDKAGLSPSEIAALEGADAETALATMGDDAPDVVQATSPDADTDDANTDDAGDVDEIAEDAPANADDGALTAEQLDAIAKDAAPEPAKLPTYEVLTKDFAAERKTLRESRKEIQAKWEQGELTDEELQTQQDAVDDKLEALTAEKVRAETLTTINEQNKREAKAKIDAEFSAATTATIKAAMGSTTARVDYIKDKVAQRQFDMALDMLQADPENASKTPAQLVQQAHRSVLAVRGLPTGEQVKKPTNTQASASTPPKPRDVPVTLAGLPNASQVPLEDETLTQAARLSGEDLEQFMARLSPAQQAKLMRTVDNRAVSH